MRQLAALLLTLCLGSYLKAEDAINTLTEAEKKAGFTLLFDGKTTNGWRGYQQKEVPSGWKVIDGLLTRVGGGGDIVTEKEYTNFELHLDWKLQAKGNSGVMYHVKETEKAPYMTGPEMQVLDNDGHADGKNATTRAGTCYALYPCKSEVCKKAGEWNTMKLIVKGQHVEHWLNGTKVCEYEKGGAEWKKKVAESKFKAWPNFGVPTSGHLCLQDHGDKVEYRNVKIKVME